MHKYLKTVTPNNKITEILPWESNELSNEKISSIITSNYSLVPNLINRSARLKAQFHGRFLKQYKVTYTHGPIANIYIVYKLISSINNTGVTLENCLFGAVKLTNNDVLINTNIQDMVLDLIQQELFHIKVMDLANMLLFLGLI